MPSTDYTILPLGTNTEGGEIKECPHCQRPGLEKSEGKEVIYLHLLVADPNSSPQVYWDQCPKRPDLKGPSLK